MHTTLAFEGTSSLTAGNLALVASDIIAILTGETDKNNLSAMNSPGGTSIASTYPAGWEVWDDDTGTLNQWILRAPTIDDATQYKYVMLTFNVTAYLQISFSLMEDWNPTTNTSTNACSAWNTNYGRFPTNNYGPNNTLEIMATARYIMFRGNIYTGTINFGIACMEISRRHPCLGIGEGRIPAFQTTTNTFFGGNDLTSDRYARIPRMLDDAGTADIINSTYYMVNGGIRPMTNFANEFDQLSEDIAYDNSATAYYGIQNIHIEYRSLVGQVCGSSEVSDVFIAQGGVVAGFEDRTLHSLDTADDTRCVWKTDNNITSHGYIRFMIQAE